MPRETRIPLVFPRDWFRPERLVFRSGVAEVEMSEMAKLLDRVCPTAPLEKDVQKAIVYTLRKCGCTVLISSQTRASRVTVGFPDLMVWNPRKSKWYALEVKRPKGRGVSTKTSDEQRELVRIGASAIVTCIEEALKAVEVVK